MWFVGGGSDVRSSPDRARSLSGADSIHMKNLQYFKMDMFNSNYCPQQFRNARNMIVNCVMILRHDSLSS